MNSLTLVADGLAALGDERLVAIESLGSRLGAVGKRDLERLEAELHGPVHVVGGGVAGEAARGAAEEAVYGFSRDASPQIPQREVDRAHRTGCDAGGAVGLGEAKHQVCETVRGEAILAGQGGAEVVAHQGCNRSRKLGGPEPAHAVFGPHPYPQVAPGHERVEVDAPPAIARERVGDVLVAVPGGAAREHGRRRRRRGRVAQSLDRSDLHRGVIPVFVTQRHSSRVFRSDLGGRLELFSLDSRLSGTCRDPSLFVDSRESRE